MNTNVDCLKSTKKIGSFYYNPHFRNQNETTNARIQLVIFYSTVSKVLIYNLKTTSFDGKQHVFLFWGIKSGADKKFMHPKALFNFFKVKTELLLSFSKNLSAFAVKKIRKCQTKNNKLFQAKIGQRAFSLLPKALATRERPKSEPLVRPMISIETFVFEKMVAFPTKYLVQSRFFLVKNLSRFFEFCRKKICFLAGRQSKSNLL